MRARKPVDGRCRHGKAGHREGHRWPNTEPRRAIQDDRDQAEQGKMERDNRAEASHPKEQGIEDITKPFPIAPRTPSQGERKQVLAGYGVMTQDLFTGLNVHTSIRIGH